MSRTRSTWEDADDIGPPLDLLIEALQWVGGVQLGSVLAGEGHVGEHVGFAVDDESGELWPAGASWASDITSLMPVRPRALRLFRKSMSLHSLLTEDLEMPVMPIA